MSILKVHLKVVVNLCAGVPVFPEYWDKTKEIAFIIDSRNSAEKAKNKGNPYIRSFSHFVEVHSWLRKLPKHVQALDQSINGGLSHVNSHYQMLVENWFGDLVGEYGFKAEYGVVCPWYQELTTEVVLESSQQTNIA